MSGTDETAPSRAAQASSSASTGRDAAAPRLPDVVRDHVGVRVESEQALAEVERLLRRAAAASHQAVDREGGGLPVVEALVGHEDAVAHPHPVLEPEAFPGGQLPDVGEPRVDRLAVRHREDPGEAGGSALRGRPPRIRAGPACPASSRVPTPATIRCLAMSIPPVDECRAPERGSSEPARRMSQGIAPAAGGPHRSASGAAAHAAADESRQGRPPRFRPRHPKGRRQADPGGPGWGGINGGDPRPTGGREWGGSRLCSPARVGGVDGGERGDTLRQPAGGLTSQRATTACASRLGGQQLPRNSYARLAPGPSRAPFPLHGEGPGSAPAGGNFRGTATSACARGRGVLPRMHAAGPAWSRHATAGSSTRAGPRHAPRMHAEGPGECARVGKLTGNSYLSPRRGRAVRCLLCTAKALDHGQRGTARGAAARQCGRRHVGLRSLPESLDQHDPGSFLEVLRAWISKFQALRVPSSWRQMIDSPQL